MRENWEDGLHLFTNLQEITIKTETDISREQRVQLVRRWEAASSRSLKEITFKMPVIDSLCHIHHYWVNELH
jgi:hypothetical protein